jgi:hypothetical protein
MLSVKDMFNLHPAIQRRVPLVVISGAVKVLDPGCFGDAGMATRSTFRHRQSRYFECPSDLTIPFGDLLVQDVQDADHVQLGGQDNGRDCRVEPSRDSEHEEHEEGED